MAAIGLPGRALDQQRHRFGADTQAQALQRGTGSLGERIRITPGFGDLGEQLALAGESLFVSARRLPRHAQESRSRAPPGGAGLIPDRHHGR